MISVTEGLDLKDIKVIIKDDILDKVICTKVGTGENPDVLITVDNIGTTSIDIPDIQYVSVETIKLSETEITMEFNSSITLTAEVYPNDATEKSVRWESDNPKVAQVNNGIVVSGEIEGTATIIATAGGVITTCKVTVIPEFPLEEVTKEKWVECFNKLKFPLENYTYVDNDCNLMVDGTTYFYSTGSNENYFQHDGDNYYKYTFIDNNWTREVIDETAYNTLIYRVTRSMFASYDLGSKYNQFTLENGVYYTSQLNSGSTGISNISIAFKNSTVFYIQYGSDIENPSKLSNFGTTVVELPEKYTDIK